MSTMDYSEIQEILMRELRLMHAPVAIKYFFDPTELAAFQANSPHYTPAKALTFCQAEIGARMEGLTVLMEQEKLGCANARYVFGWKELDESEVKSHLKYCTDLDQAQRVVEGKPRLTKHKLLAVSVGPLAHTVGPPDVVHLYCDNIAGLPYFGGLDGDPGRPSFSPFLERKLCGVRRQCLCF